VQEEVPVQVCRMVPRTINCPAPVTYGRCCW
jgi:hypothetical protein